LIDGTGIIARDGKDIKFPELAYAIHKTYNFAPTFCRYAPQSAADYLNKDYYKDTISLHEVDKHNATEHDASFTRAFT